MEQYQPDLVSVIVIFYNAAQFIREAISSVFDQTYPQWELILVDDGSTDLSTQIAQETAAQFPERVRYVQHDNHANRGQSISRNRGVNCASGEFIALLDADDVYLPQKLEKQVAILKEYPQAGMVFSASLQWFSWTQQPDGAEQDYARKLNLPLDRLYDPPELVKAFLRNRAWTPGTSSFLVRHSVYEAVDCFDENYRGIMDDQIFFYKVCLRSPIFIQSGLWDYYRQHPSSLTHQAARLGEYDIHRPNPAYRGFYEWLKKYLKDEKVTDPQIWMAFYRKFWAYQFPALYRLFRPLREFRVSSQ